MHKVGGFFQLDFNPRLFKAIRKECQYGEEKFPEFNMAFGWTIKVYNPIWIHFGPGFTGKMYYGTYLDKKYPKNGYGKEEWGYLDSEEMGYKDYPGAKDINDVPEDRKDAWTHSNFAAAISPVIGVTAKYSYFAIRLTYQYRWAIQKDLKDFIGNNRLSIGVGISF